MKRIVETAESIDALREKAAEVLATRLPPPIGAGMAGQPHSEWAAQIAAAMLPAELRAVCVCGAGDLIGEFALNEVLLYARLRAARAEMAKAVRAAEGEHELIHKELLRKDRIESFQRTFARRRKTKQPRQQTLPFDP